MGANAQTAVPAFTAGQVLTAAQMTQVNTGIPVFATTVTRDAAFGGTGEKTLAQGQYAYIEASSTLQVYSGSAWVNVGSGLVFLTGASFSAAATVSLPASTFTTTYSNYRVMFDVSAASVDSSVVTCRLRAAGSDSSAASYSNAGVTYFIGGATIGANNVLSGTAWTFTQFNGTDNNALMIDLYNPQATQITKIFYQNYGRVGGAQGGVNGSGQFNATTAFDSLTVYPASGTITGSYKVYGYSNS